jgi:hypothetical protein
MNLKDIIFNILEKFREFCVLERSQILFNQILVAYKIRHLAAHVET